MDPELGDDRPEVGASELDGSGAEVCRHEFDERGELLLGDPRGGVGLGRGAVGGDPREVALLAQSRDALASPSVGRTLTEMAGSVRHLLVHLEASLDHPEEARPMFEAAIARRAAERRSEAHIAAITAVPGRRKASKPGTAGLLRSEGAFPNAIARVSEKPLLAEIGRLLSEFRVEKVRKPGLGKPNIAEHEAIRKGDADESSRQMLADLSRANALCLLGPQGG